MRRLRLVLEYDGTDFCGFQRQPDRPSIQGELERALGQICGHPVGVAGAGRTDAGVHALGQVVHFDTTGRIPTERIPRVLNGLIGPRIVVRYAEETGQGFHARFSAASRHYDYFLTRETPDPLLTRFVAEAPYLGEDAAVRMNEALRPLSGTHDFRAFCGSGSDPGGTVRTLLEASAEERRGILRLRFAANGFLKSMVRIITGQLIEIAGGRAPVQSLAEALSSRERPEAALAPARGLTLVRVEYPDGFPGGGVLKTTPFWVGG